ncbi:MAG: iron-sulfur cluster carrier protein ApbC [Gammaproteobacteria bacterium]|jgi:ATP-binding protein involved in chromosome partitioning|nr:iron-sulfur cluster carrier protein ApbC [Gammaproteobacteria bacterium]MBT3724304.1 iron-sulfur cluster carrier protein ApbC [Gammaproteobacteria bacterium]MBT4077866.1 iron-sulfur cluster carrier protein ApbC [Gammaproteobacteria bacterium]MBT4196683.1 iron-sulfur cluster carrier protein ApbC [Gammaproteobacteria bacterium]MBT4448506.1 iron-sulfur cluster carrier protein ApbC [Gammaproteobacteria bacterium]
MSITKEQVQNAIGGIIDVNTERDLAVTKSVKSIEIEGAKVSINIVLGYPAAGYFDTLKSLVSEAVSALEGVESVAVKVSSKIVSHAVQQNLKPQEGIKNIIAIASGKGGVGKSTTAVNLALALQAEGATVAILDADIYGPSMPRMLGCTGQPESIDGKSLEPKVGHGIQSMSIGYLVEEDTPMIWRGPMVTQALEQLLNDTNWKDIDYMVIDLPPGTGDTQLTLAQKIPVSGAVIVTTPQDIALLDARKGLKMFEKVEVPVLGIVENMSIHICSECNHAEHIFGEGGGTKMAEEYGVDFLGALPLDIKIREHADSGNPTVASMPDSKVSEIYREIARKTAAKLATKAKDHSSAFPSIVIQNN